MDKDIIRTFIWNEINRLAFKPNVSNYKKWINSYLRSLPLFWGSTYQPEGPSIIGESIVGKFENNGVDFACKFTLQHDHSLCLDFTHADSRILSHHSDCSGPYLIPKYHQSDISRNVIISHSSEDDYNKVIESLLMHPRDHTHIEFPKIGHKIRLSGSVFNFYSYLFHLRIQLCPDKDKRKAEKDRLKELFKNAVENEHLITSDALFAELES